MLSLRGLGPVITTGILTKVTDIKRFPGDPQLAKPAGLVWRKHASTDFVAQVTRLSKVGHVYLRYYLIQGANLLRQYNLDYPTYYQRKVEEASKHKHIRALVLTARKFVHPVHALLKKHQPFVARSTAMDPSEATDLYYYAMSEYLAVFESLAPRCGGLRAFRRLKPHDIAL